MSDLLKTWMVDAESFEMQKLYGVKEIPTYDFTERQGDFYITLLNRMYSEESTSTCNFTKYFLSTI